MRKLLASLAFVLFSITAQAAVIDYRALLPAFFTTNGGFVGINGRTVPTNISDLAHLTGTNVFIGGSNFFDRIFGSISATNVDYTPGINITFTTNLHNVAISASSSGTATATNSIVAVLTNGVSIGAVVITNLNLIGNGITVTGAVSSGQANVGFTGAPLLPEYYLFTNGTLIGPKGVISTAGTVTAGIQEAINDMVLAPNSNPTNKVSIPGGGRIIVQGPGRLTCTGQVIIPSYTNRPFSFTIKGSGLPQVFYNGPGGSNFVITTEYNGATLFNGLRFESDGIAWLMGPNTTNCIFKLGAFQQAIFRNNVIAWNTGLTNEQPGVTGGYTYNYELTQPVQPGVVGVWLEPSSSVWSEFTGNTFYGLACAIAHFGNRGIISGNTFGSIGSFYTNGVYTYNTLWTNVTYKNTQASFMGIGPAILYKTFDVSEMTIRDNSFLKCGAGVMNNAGYINVVNDYYFGGNYRVLAYDATVGHVTIYRSSVNFVNSDHDDGVVSDSGSLPWFTFGPINQSPDFLDTFTIFSSAGNGMTVYGDLNASNNVSVLGNFTYKGGSPGLNKILTSDAIGLAAWQSLNAFSLQYSNIGPVHVTTNAFTTTQSAVLLGNGGYGVNSSGNLFSGTDGFWATNATRDFPSVHNATITTTSNYNAGYLSYATNQSQIQPDFSIPFQLMSTNAAFTFLAPKGVDPNKKTVQTCAIYVTNTTASVISVTPPVNCHGVGPMNVTNLTRFTVECYAGAFTNMFSAPVF